MTGMASLKVTVKDINTNRAIEGALVEVGGRTARTSRYGDACFLSLPETNCNINVEAQGYTPSKAKAVPYSNTTILLVPKVRLL